MMPPELQLRSFRPFISSSASAPTFSSFNGRRSPDQTLNTNSNFASTPTSSRSPSTSSRYSPSSFSHNPRFAIALVPSAAFLLDLGGAPVLATLAIGLIIVYILDSLSFKSGAFFGLWFSLIFAQIAFFFASPLMATFNSFPLAILAAFLCSHFNFLIGVWASLQFKWIQIENPSIVLALESLLFACVPLSASAIFTWATIYAVGMVNASYYLMVFNCVFYWLFSTPRLSCFKSNQAGGYQGGMVPDDNLILGSLESCIHTLNLLFSPLMLHIASHYSTLSVSDMCLLFFIPFLFQLYASTRGALWWVSKSPYWLQRIRVVNGTLALIVVVICLEVRVVFRSFGRYIQVPPPFNYLLVTFTMFGGGASAAAYTLGMIGDAFSSMVFSVLAVLVSSAGAIILGLPILLLPLPAVSGFYLARFFTKKSLPSYFAFAALGSLMVTWYVWHTYWDLNIWLAGMSLKSFCKLIITDSTLAILLPGLALLPSKFHLLTEFALTAHALLLCYIENRFFSYTPTYYFGMENDVMYPSYMVIMTTILGLALVRRLQTDHRIGSKSVWILTCLHFSKLSMLFFSSKSVVWVSAVLLLAVSPPVLLYREKSIKLSKMKAWQGCAHAGVVTFSVWLFRETIFEALQWWNGRSPSDGLLLGFCILLTGLACIPIVALHFSHVACAKKWLLLVVATGFLLILIQPPIFLSWNYHSDLIKAALHSTDDLSIYGFIPSDPTWPSWFLIASLLLALAAATSLIPTRYVAEFRLLYSASLGISLGVWVSARYYTQPLILHLLLVLIITLTPVTIIFTHFPTASSTKIIPRLFFLIFTLQPLHYIFVPVYHILYGAEGKIVPEDNKNIVQSAGLQAGISMLVALVMKFEIAFRIREKALERAGFRPNGNPNPRMRFGGQDRRRIAAPAFARAKGEVGWMAVVGNVATVLCFLMCMVLAKGSDRSIFFLAPLLLLLNQDSDFMSGFGERQRYFPVTAAMSGFLAVIGLWEVLMREDGGFEIGGVDWLFVVKNVALLVLTIPSHVLFNRFVWSYKKTEGTRALITLPLNLPGILMGDVVKIRILGLLGIIYPLAQYLISRQEYIMGMKYI